MRRNYIDPIHSYVEHVCPLSPMQASGYCYKIKTKISQTRTAHSEQAAGYSNKIKSISYMSPNRDFSYLISKLRLSKCERKQKSMLEDSLTRFKEPAGSLVVYQ